MDHAGTSAPDDRGEDGPRDRAPAPPHDLRPEPEPEPRTRARRAWKAVAAVCALAVVGAVAIPTYSWAIQQQSTTSWQAVHAITAVDVMVGDGDLTVTAGPAGRVSMTESLSWDQNKPSVTETWAGDVLEIAVSCAQHSGLMSGHDCSTLLNLTVPTQTAVTATSASGDLSASHIAGPLHLNSDSGDVTLDSTSGTVEAGTTSGDVDATGLMAAAVTAESDSGSVALTFAEPPKQASVTSVSGSVTVLVPPGSRYRVSGSSTTGGWLVDPSLPDPASPASITLRSTSGSVLLQYQTS